MVSSRFCKINRNNLYITFFYTNKIAKLDFSMKKFINSHGPSFYHIKIKTGTLLNLVRPKKFDDLTSLIFLNDNSYLACSILFLLFPKFEPTPK